MLESVFSDAVEAKSAMKSARECSRPVRTFQGMQEHERGAFFSSMWQEHTVRPGFRVSTFDAHSPEEFSFTYSKENNYIDFGFFLEGEFLHDLRETPVGQLKLENQAGSGRFGFCRHTSGTVHLPEKKKIRTVHIHILPDVLASLLHGDTDCLQPYLRNVLEQGNDADFIRHCSLTPKVQACANELFSGVQNRFGNRLYLEGKVLELLGLTLGERRQSADGRQCTLCPRERDTIYAIRKELEESFMSPPTLAELSFKYSLGAHKIQAGFKSMFGMSVFTFIKEFKLQKAKLLFEEGNMNVSEVAWAIGYINLSHFSAAYRKRFGVLPKAYLASIREKPFHRTCGTS